MNTDSLRVLWARTRPTMVVNMTPRVTRSLKLLFLVLLVGFSSLLPAPNVADASSCVTGCWNICYSNYFECVGDGGSPSVCCQGANRCANYCGNDCPLFC